MSDENALSQPESTGGEPFKPTGQTILAGVALVVLFAAAALSPLFTWMSISPAEDDDRGTPRFQLTGFGSLTVKMGESEGKSEVSGEGAPQGLLIAVIAGVSAILAVVALVFLFVGGSKEQTQSVLKYACTAIMAGAIILVAAQMFWIWKIRSFNSYVEEEREKQYQEATKRGRGIKLPATVIGPGPGLYAGIVASVLALLAASELSRAAGKRARGWIRIGQGAGVALGAAVILLVKPWDGEQVAKALDSAKRDSNMPAIQKVRERSSG